jgi:2-keto-4-pentenoate hydratase
MIDSRHMVDALWRSRRTADAVVAPPLTPDEGFAVLTELVGRAVDEGDEVIGWKIARLPGDGNAEPFLFAAPVFRSSLEPLTGRRLAGPKVEVELVGRIETINGNDASAEHPWTMSWRVGLELVANHDPDWSMTPGWAIADWGLHAAAVLGEACRQPEQDEPVPVQIAVEGEEGFSRDGAWRIGTANLATVLERDAARVVRPCQTGDLVWTGALIPPMPLTIGPTLVAVVGGFGSVRLGGHDE